MFKKALAAIAVTPFLFWFNLYYGSEKVLLMDCANHVPFATSSSKDFTANNGNPEVKLCSIVNNFTSPVQYQTF